ncbi:MAG: hypothetical protein HWN81_06180 [Candidatus Lokiarchaeota archaeon]|nr:hypothetical protein [Candidatus Lokiarchaeota archaeon]
MSKIKIVKVSAKAQQIKKNFIAQMGGSKENYEAIINAEGRYLARLKDILPENYFRYQNIYRF